MRTLDLLTEYYKNEPINHNNLRLKLVCSQRAMTAFLMTIYLTLSESKLFPATIPLFIWSVTALYLGLQLIATWTYRKFETKSAQVTQFYVFLDIAFASLFYLTDAGLVSLGSLYLFTVLVANTCPFSPLFFLLTTRQTLIIFFLTTLLHFSMRLSFPTFTWYIQLLFYFSGLTAIAFLYQQLSDAKAQIAKSSELDPVTGTLHPDAFERAARIATEIKTSRPENKTFMLLEIANLTEGSQTKDQSKLILLDALKQLTRILHINLKIDDLISHYEENIFAVLLHNTGEEEAESIGLALQHEFAHWTHQGHGDLGLSVAISSVPSFSVPIRLLYLHTKEAFGKIQDQLGAAGIIVTPSITSESVAAFMTPQPPSSAL